MIRDPIPALQSLIRDYLASKNISEKVEIDGEVSSSAPWRPHVFERKIFRGWHIHAVAPTSDSWALRALRATAKVTKLRVGIAVLEEFLSDEDFLDSCHQLNAAIIIFKATKDTFLPVSFYNSVDDLIYQRRLKLSLNCAARILDRSLIRALAAGTKVRKGVLLEVLVAVLLSQVDGFEVTDVGISNRTQQMDVMVHNRNVGGALSTSPVVLAEAKNWRDPVGTDEYANFVRKIESRHRRAKLGYFVTTGNFTSGVTLERRRESTSETLVVLLDKITLPNVWRGEHSITESVERATMLAAIGT
ncbi:MAG: hypothetical protein QOJ15_470 [Bradyrhizobium sp.]|nr:hypothetical protein [Bradyrhizobium sp.]